MDCTDCGPRKDRPHLFVHHDPDTCPSCHDKIEARVVFRGEEVVRLIHCPKCGPQERVTDAAPAAYMDAFVAQGQVPAGHVGDWVFKKTTSTCPACLKLIEVDVVLNDGQAFFQKECPHCSTSSRALVSEDADYYVKAYTYAREGTEPHAFGNEVEHGCPTDCGTCGDHEQHTCLPIVEVTDHCNLECPICIVDNQYSTHMSLEVFQGIVDDLVAKEGQCESIAISGGEPTSHPQIEELVKIANRPEIGRVVVITNGLRLGRDEGLAKMLKAQGAYVGLQLDGFDAETHKIIRGKDLMAEKNAALEMLRKYEIPTQMIFVATQGVNDHQIGQAVELFLKEDHFLSLNFQPVAYTGHGGGKFGHNPLDRLTIPGVIKRLEEQTDGMLMKSDFNPLPCSHPQCVSLSYLMRLDEGEYLPFARFTDFEKNGALLKSSATLPASAEVHDALQDVIYDVYAREDEIEHGPRILASLRRSLKKMFPDRTLTNKEQVRIGEGEAKSIFIHHYMDRHDFDLERLRKCCHHYPQEGGKVMPACGYNMFHRGAAKGEGTDVPSWGMAAPSGAGTAGARLRVLSD